MIYNQVNLTKMRETPAPARLFEKKIYFGSQNAAANDVFQVIPAKPDDIIIAAWVEVITACTANATIDFGYGSDVDYFGNELPVDSVGKCQTALNGSKTWDTYDIYDQSENTEEIEITGARHGDHVSVSPSIDIADMSITAEVIHPDWVAIHYVNNTGGNLNLPSHTVDVVVNKAPRMANPLFFSAGDTLDVKANQAITEGVLKVSAVIIRK